jgi:hypothetical protein
VLRKGLVAIGIIELAVGLTIACGSFSSDDAPLTTLGDASDEDAGISLDSPPPDTFVPDGAAALCSAFDAAAAVQPATGLDNYPCGSSMVNLLGNPQHCGWCNHLCLDAPTCNNGVCAPLALVTGPVNTSLELDAVDDANVFWVDQGRLPTALFKASNTVPSDQSSAAKLVEVDLIETINTKTYGLAIADQIYLHTYTRLLHAPIDGGPLTVFSTTSAGNEITPLVAARGHLFQTSYSGTGAFIDFLSADAAVLSQQTNVGYALDLATTPDGRFAFVIGRKAVDAGTAVPRAAIYRYTVATKEFTRIAVFDVMDAPGSALAADDDSVYFSEGLAGSILKLGVDAPSGTEPTVLSKGDGRHVRHIAIDDRRVYWFSSTAAPNYDDWDLFSVDKCGGGNFKHVAKEDNRSFSARGLVAHGKHLYWGSRNQLFRVAK